MPETKSKRPNDTPFKQQKLKAWQPILTPKSVVCTFSFIGILFIPIGIGVLVSSASVIDVGPIRYNGVSDDGTTFVKFDWPESTTSRVFFYYQLSNFYQNHRRYVRSRSDVQLAGSSLADVQSLGDCSPLETFADRLPNNIDDITIPPGTDLASIRLNPCGLIANSQFNDTFRIFTGHCEDDSACGSGSNPEITSNWTKNGIAWSSDRDRKFKNFEGFDGTPTIQQQKDVEDEEFIVWMRTAGLPTFKKLHRIIPAGLDAGQYTIRVVQNFPVRDFDGEKAFYLSTTTWIGGKNDFLGWAYIVVGAVCLLLALAFFVKHRMDPRSIGDPQSVGKRN